MAVHRLDLEASIRFDMGPISGGRWHVGSGFRTAGVDRMVRRFPGRTGVPFIPGSQIRGVLRNQCERLLVALGGEYSDPHGVLPADGTPWALETFKPLRDLPKRVVVDRLFGTRYDGERLFVSNAFPEQPAGGSGAGWQTDAVTRTSMDRLLGIVAEGKLFTTEVVSSTVPYRFTLRGRHRSDELTVLEGYRYPVEYALLIAGLLTLDSIGADRSAGFGWCTVSVDRMTYQGEPVEVEEVVRFLRETGREYVEYLETFGDG